MAKQKTGNWGIAFVGGVVWAASAWLWASRSDTFALFASLFSLGCFIGSGAELIAESIRFASEDDFEDDEYEEDEEEQHE